MTICFRDDTDLKNDATDFFGFRGDFRNLRKGGS